MVLLARGDPDQLVEAERLSKRAVELDPDDARDTGAWRLHALRRPLDESLEAFDQPRHAIRSSRTFWSTSGTP